MNGKSYYESFTASNPDKVTRHGKYHKKNKYGKNTTLIRFARSAEPIERDDLKKPNQPSNSARNRVRAMFDAEMLIDICERPENDFHDYANYVALPGAERFYYYKDNGSDILAVAHLDTVCKNRSCTVTTEPGGLIARSGALDDRLGAYAILELLPNLGITCDWLLTTDEESCNSTAEQFQPPEGKQYKWMFQFDRGGNDVVMYQYDNAELRGLVKDAGAEPGHGSFSDIRVLDHLGCRGLNWGIGYQDYHSNRGYAWVDDIVRMVARFEKFYRANAEVSMPFVKQPVLSWRDFTNDGGIGTYRYAADWAWDPDELDDFVAKSTASKELVVYDDAMFDDYINAECGHEINLNKPETYAEIDRTVVCRRCGEMGGIAV